MITLAIEPIIGARTRRDAETDAVTRALEHLGLPHLDHTDDGVPFVPGRPDLHISVTHSRTMAAVAAARHPIGIDIETPRAQLAHVLPRVATGPEIASIAPLHLWTAKEAVFKAGGRPGVDFRRDISVTGLATALFRPADTVFNLAYLSCPENNLLCIASSEAINTEYLRYKSGKITLNTMNRPNLVFATNNTHKLEEIRRIVGDRINILSLNDIDCHDDIPENEPTLEGNAVAKARWIRDRYGVDCFADDTGLEVAALGGQPGVRSARYAPGNGHDAAANTALLLRNLEGVTDRTARFRTVICLILDRRQHIFEGIVNGRITDAPVGNAGFGYDPVFAPEGDSRTFAQYTPDEKNAVSHRGRATAALIEFLDKTL